MKITTTALALMIGVAAGPNVLTAQSHHPEAGPTMGASPTEMDMNQMRGMCQQMMSTTSTMGMRDGGARGEMGMMGGRSMMDGQSTMGPQPSMLLGQREALELSGEQIERLEAMKERATERRASHMVEMKLLAEEITAVSGENAPDLDRLESLLSQQAEAHVGMRVGKARMAQETMSLLTTEQRSNLRYGMHLMRSMMQNMGEKMGSSESRPHEHDDNPR